MNILLDAINSYLEENLISMESRDKLPDHAFALPHCRKYPFHTEEDARNSLEWVKKLGTEEQKELVKLAIMKKYPNINKKSHAVTMESTSFSVGDKVMLNRDVDTGSGLLPFIEKGDVGIVEEVDEHEVSVQFYDRYSIWLGIEDLDPVNRESNHKVVDESVEEGRWDWHYQDPDSWENYDFTLKEMGDDGSCAVRFRTSTSEYTGSVGTGVAELSNLEEYKTNPKQMLLDTKEKNNLVDEDFVVDWLRPSVWTRFCKEWKALWPKREEIHDVTDD